MLATLASNLTRWMPEAHSTFADDVDWLFYFLVWLTAFFLVLIGGLAVYFSVRYRRTRDRMEGEHTPTHHTALEMTWTVIPLIAVLGIFFWGFRGYVDMSIPPDDAYDIRVESYTWGWNFVYPNGASSNVLYVPADRAVRLTLTSRDVLHSVFIPDFRVKRDAVPGRYNRTWFQARWLDNAVVRVADEVDAEEDDDLRGTVHQLYCAEYCGDQHSRMLAKVVVLQLDDFRDKVRQLGEIDPDAPPAEIGQRIVANQCAACHSIDGETRLGPTFLDVYGDEREMADGSTELADEQYIREQILYPRRRTVAGFDPNAMPSFQGLLSDREIDGVIAYLQSISEHYDGEAGLNDEPADEADEAADADDADDDPTDEANNQ